MVIIHVSRFSLTVHNGLIMRVCASLLRLQQLIREAWKSFLPHLVVSLTITAVSLQDANLIHSGTDRVLVCHFHLLGMVPVEMGCFLSALCLFLPTYHVLVLPLLIFYANISEAKYKSFLSAPKQIDDLTISRKVVR